MDRRARQVGSVEIWTLRDMNSIIRQIAHRLPQGGDIEGGVVGLRLVLMLKRR
jgi:hypothetical protein